MDALMHGFMDAHMHPCIHASMSDPMDAWRHVWVHRGMGIDALGALMHPCINTHAPSVHPCMPPYIHGFIHGMEA